MKSFWPFISASTFVRQSPYSHHISSKLLLLRMTFVSVTCEIANLSKSYCELSGRSEPIIADVILGFVEMGFNFNKLDSYIKGMKHTHLPNLQPQQQQKLYNMLAAGTKQPLPPHIPQHLPQFPDPHAYVRTPTHKQPIIDYESVREKAAIQKRDIEKALTKFLAKTSTTHNLFDSDEANIFPYI
ncbi:unnamed protein product [Acanthoscelides obtectus]|uniref:Transcription initiation factor TFIID subunit 8 n=1 Tax=Acanthoscelides obtectus TaxID=200917 RepID=A0A9P0L9M3_ACAOB|nr:unnamed protein product [Acanthoscelides obtectus]CAK1656794.1 Transcription initiation factor TFIID subunit 8 [Acanthoscelides obtectus]